jgi:hypothetical protein
MVSIIKNSVIYHDEYKLCECFLNDLFLIEWSDCKVSDCGIPESLRRRTKFAYRLDEPVDDAKNTDCFRSVIKRVMERLIQKPL